MLLAYTVTTSSMVTSDLGSNCSIADFGAIPDNHTINTRAFAGAVAHCAALPGPSTVFVPPGVWLTGAFNLTSNMTLELSRGATITGSMDWSDYPQVAVFPSYGKCNDGGCWKLDAKLNDTIAPSKTNTVCKTRTSALISVFDATNVRIIGHAPDTLKPNPRAGPLPAIDYAGSSVVDGQGCVWWKRKLKGELPYCRPELINIINSTNVEIAGVVLTDSPFWTTHIVYSRNVHIHDFSVRTAWGENGRLPPKCVPAPAGFGGINTDGIDVDSSEDVLIERVMIDTGDDAIAIKSGEDAAGRTFGRPARNITVRASRLVAATFAIGSEMSGGVDGVTLRDTIVSDDGGAAMYLLRVKSKRGRGGYVRNIRLQNVHAPALKSRDARSAVALSVDAEYCCQEPEGPVAQFSNFTFENVSVGALSTGVAGLFRGGNKSMLLRGVAMRGVRIGHTGAEGAGVVAWHCGDVDTSSFTADAETWPPLTAGGGSCSHQHTG